MWFVKIQMQFMKFYKKMGLGINPNPFKNLIYGKRISK